ncbi:transmembrane protein [Cystoisospora suis]|uniref:Transmembrane protein n=1 Tax=Cystoisospora suis TaxID=483139 RepID=A0A2C6LCH1_9APIC|nr:transmembrane protein [Cystoisospora suis]
MSSSLPAHPSSFPGDRGGGEIIRGAGGQATERGGMNASSQQHHQQHAYFSYPPAYHSSHAAGGHYMAPGGGGADQPQQQVLTRRRDDRGERYFSPMSPAGGGGGGGVVDRGVYTPGYHNYTQDGTTTHLLYEERGRGAGWTYGGPGGGRREEGEEEMSRGIGGDGAYAGGGGGGHRESIRRKGDVGGRKKAKPRSKKKDRKVTWFVSVYTVVLLVLFVGCAVSGVFVGIIVTSPTVRLASSSLQLDHGWSNNPNHSSAYLTVRVSRHALPQLCVVCLSIADLFEFIFLEFSSCSRQTTP